jgi:plasmid stabilization system protein ParE
MKFNIVIDPLALGDIQDAIDYYDDKKLGLGVEFENQLHQHFVSLSSVKFFQVRYGEIRCLPVRRFAFMIHYSVDEAKHLIIIRAVFHTGMDPRMWEKRDQ